MNNILVIKNLYVQIKKKEILKNINLTIKKGEIHIIIGKNGSGKSTLAKILTRHHDYKVKNGIILYKNKNLLNYKTEECAQNGIFLSFQNPVSIPGLKNIQFLKESINSLRKKKHRPPLSTEKFLVIVNKIIKKLKMNEQLLDRSVNENFSGGEKKYNEILQMLLLKPTFIILDEIDSGLDVNATKIIMKKILQLKKKKTILVITHSESIINYLKPDYIHVMEDGKIIKTENFSSYTINNTNKNLIS